MKKLTLLLLLLLISAKIFPQGNEKQNPNVQLPDFVITGKDVVSLQKAKKIDPGYITTISEAFIKPYFSPEELGFKEFLNPIQNDIALTDPLRIYNTNINIATGIYTSPAASINFAQPFRGGIFETLIEGNNHRAYINNTDRFSVRGGANLSFYPSITSSIKGTEFKFHGDYGLSQYKFYASNTPTQKRNFYTGNFSAEINNLVNRQFNFNILVEDNYTFLNNENFTENLLKINGLLKANFSYFKIGAYLNYQRQSIDNNLIINGNFNYFSARPFVQIEFQNSFKLIGGATYSSSGAKDYVAPYISAALKPSNFVSLYGEYKPSAEFVTSGYLLRGNEYFNPQAITNIFVKKTNDLKFTFKYEYYTFFEVDAGFTYFKADNLPYYMNSIQSGSFDVGQAAAENYSVFIDLLFHQGPNGTFYGSAVYSDTKDLNNKYIPYSPKLKVNISYGFQFGFGLYAEPKVYINSESFADLANTLKIDSNINLGLKLAYKFAPNFSLNAELFNLIDRKNFKWYGYQQPPLDLLAGLTYKW